jgi:hypothetical protein
MNVPDALNNVIFVAGVDECLSINIPEPPLPPKP